MATVKSKDVNELKEQLVNKIERCNKVLQDLGNSGGFRVVLDDLKNGIKVVDGQWHKINPFKDPHKIEELRIAKLATDYLVNLLQMYEGDKNKAQSQLYALENPDKVVNKDYDSE